MSSQDKTAVQPVGGKTADKVFRGVAYACEQLAQSLPAVKEGCGCCGTKS